MKLLVRLLLFISTLSCNSKNIKPLLFGSWTRIGNSSALGTPGATDSVVFKKPDLLKVYFLMNEKVIDSLVGRFYIDRGKSRLTTRYDTNTFQFDIVELTQDSLQIKQSGKRLIQKYKRLSY